MIKPYGQKPNLICSVIKVKKILLLSKKVLPKYKTLVNFKSHFCKIATSETVILVSSRNSKVFYTNIIADELPNLILGIVFPWRNLLLHWLLLKLHYTELLKRHIKNFIIYHVTIIQVRPDNRFIHWY